MAGSRVNRTRPPNGRHAAAPNHNAGAPHDGSGQVDHRPSTRQSNAQRARPRRARGPSAATRPPPVRPPTITTGGPHTRPAELRQITGRRNGEQTRPHPPLTREATLARMSTTQRPTRTPARPQRTELNSPPPSDTEPTPPPRTTSRPLNGQLAHNCQRNPSTRTRQPTTQQTTNQPPPQRRVDHSTAKSTNTHHLQTQPPRVSSTQRPTRQTTRANQGPRERTKPRAGQPTNPQAAARVVRSTDETPTAATRPSTGRLETAPCRFRRATHGGRTPVARSEQCHPISGTAITRHSSHHSPPFLSDYPGYRQMSEPAVLFRGDKPHHRNAFG